MCTSASTYGGAAALGPSQRSPDRFTLRVQDFLPFSLAISPRPLQRLLQIFEAVGRSIQMVRNSSDIHSATKCCGVLVDGSDPRSDSAMDIVPRPHRSVTSTIHLSRSSLTAVTLSQRHQVLLLLTPDVLAGFANTPAGDQAHSGDNSVSL